MDDNKTMERAEIIAALRAIEVGGVSGKYHGPYLFRMQDALTDAAALLERDAEPPNEPLSNADRIRAMSDVELADNRVGEILGVAPCPLWVAIDAPDKQYLSKKRALEVELAWLQKPAPEEGEQNV